MILEVAVFSVNDAIVAANTGACRIELCSNYQVGGITCSDEILQQAKQKISIPIFPIIRPRAGNFVYSQQEFEQMKRDILYCKQLGFDGIVLGILSADKTVDISRTKELVELAKPLPVTFHRAFDETINPLQALEDIIECGCKRILTSGQKTTANEGKILLQQLVEKANGRIVIMPGGGVRSNYIKELQEFTMATEFHSASIKTTTSSTQANTVALDVDELKKLLLMLE